LRGETVERDQMYPQFMEQARNDRCDDAVEVFDSTADGEAVHAMMFVTALEGLEDYRERTAYQVCMVCGWVCAGVNFKRCVLCNSNKDRFERIE
jgi:rubrerythrin